MKNFPVLSDSTRVARLQPPAGVVRMVLDTDTDNEVDDQFALVYALLSPERVKVEAIYAAPYSHHSIGPAEGMERSHAEILRLLNLLDTPSDGWVFKGAAGYLKPGLQPWESPAAVDLVARTMNSSEDDQHTSAAMAPRLGCC